LVGQEDVGEDRALLDPERRGRRVVDARAEDVRRQEVRRELDALKPRGDRLRDRRGGKRLRDARHTLEQDVPAARARPAPRRRKWDRREESREEPSNQLVLADDDLADFL